MMLMLRTSSSKEEFRGHHCRAGAALQRGRRGQQKLHSFLSKLSFSCFFVSSVRLFPFVVFFVCEKMKKVSPQKHTPFRTEPNETKIIMRRNCKEELRCSRCRFNKDEDERSFLKTTSRSCGGGGGVVVVVVRVGVVLV